MRSDIFNRTQPTSAGPSINGLTIVISKEEYEQINAQAEESRAKVREMFAAYRPGALGNGNGFQSQDAPEGDDGARCG